MSDLDDRPVSLGPGDRLQAFAARARSGGRESRAIIDAATAELFEAFASAGVDVLLLKGAALAQLLYRQDEHRSYIDIDVLVAPSHLAAAGEVLQGLGYHNSTAELGIDDIGAVVHADTWVGPSKDVTYPIQVELHRWLPGAQAPPAEAWDALLAHHTSITVEGRPLPALARDGQALQLATHLAQHGPTYAKGVQELTLALERWPLAVWRDAAALAGEVGALEPFAVGLRFVDSGAVLADGLGLPVPHQLDWYVRHQDERPRGAFHLNAFLEPGGLRGRLDVMRRALHPSQKWLAQEYPWAMGGTVRLRVAYLLHALRAPLWAARAWWFRRRAARRAP